eukprot:scaffold319916_cov39-Prasinocladus_malaysianus.AAC.1
MSIIMIIWKESVNGFGLLLCSHDNLGSAQAGSSTPIQMQAQSTGRALLPLLAAVPRQWPSMAPAAFAAIETYHLLVDRFHAICLTWPAEKPSSSMLTWSFPLARRS